jgi:hypothetical protein
MPHLVIGIVAGRRRWRWWRRWGRWRWWRWIAATRNAEPLTNIDLVPVVDVIPFGQRINTNAIIIGDAR